MVNWTNSIITDELATSVGLGEFFICTAVSLVLGVLIALCHMYKNPSYSKGFVMTTALLPFIVQAIIMVVNGNVGTGVAVAGAFSLIRFRSVQGTAKDICTIFLAMAVGLASGAGFVFIAVALAVITCIILLLYVKIDFGGARDAEKILKITIPENLEYEGAFDEIFKKYLKSYEIIGTKTTDMGSLYRLTYRVVLNDMKESKAFIDDLRTKNGNLEIALNMRTESEKAL
ncbi:MAG: DUF4956 domain-containing protein [Clostridia bacterium]|nr:DUF4956 domain-containing protein [Clostridia bacterium]